MNLYRDLARERPSAFAPALAMSLQNLAFKFIGDAGNTAEAISACPEAKKLYGSLVEQYPKVYHSD